MGQLYIVSSPASYGWYVLLSWAPTYFKERFRSLTFHLRFYFYQRLVYAKLHLSLFFNYFFVILFKIIFPLFARTFYLHIVSNSNARKLLCCSFPKTMSVNYNHRIYRYINIGSSTHASASLAGYYQCIISV